MNIPPNSSNTFPQSKYSADSNPFGSPAHALTPKGKHPWSRELRPLQKAVDRQSLDRVHGALKNDQISSRALNHPQVGPKGVVLGNMVNVVAALPQSNMKEATLGCVLAADARQTAWDHQGRSPIMQVCDQSDAQSLQVLLNPVFNKLGQTPLNVNASNPQQRDWTALHYCAYRNDHVCAQILLEQGADHTLRSADGTALEMARQHGDTPLVHLLGNEGGRIWTGARHAYFEAKKMGAPVAYRGEPLSNGKLAPMSVFAMRGASTSNGTASRAAVGIEQSLVDQNPYQHLAAHASRSPRIDKAPQPPVTKRSFNLPAHLPFLNAKFWRHKSDAVQPLINNHEARLEAWAAKPFPPVKLTDRGQSRRNRAVEPPVMQKIATVQAASARNPLSTLSKVSGYARIRTPQAL